jgi:hypothetical protein
MTTIEVLHSVVCRFVVSRPRAGRAKAATGNSFVFSIPSKLALPHTVPLLVGVSGAVGRAAKWQGREANHSPPSSTEATKACLHDMHRYVTFTFTSSVRRRRRCEAVTPTVRSRSCSLQSVHPHKATIRLNSAHCLKPCAGGHSRRGS